MHFAPDTEESLEFMVELANTDAGASRSGQDELATVGQLTGLLEHYSFTGRIDHDEAELRDMRQIRALLHEVWTLGSDNLVDTVNRLLREATVSPYLTRHDDLGWHLHATAADAPLAERIRVEVAMALIDVIRMDATDRLRVCAATGCTGLLVDLSRNGSKRFCSVRCGNRMNMIAFRERRTGEAPRSAPPGG